MDSEKIYRKLNFRKVDDKLDLNFFLKNLPTSPGVYRFLDEKNVVLYVGKAKNLKNRVSQYFSKSDLSPRIMQMVGKISSVEITQTRSESEALLLENNLIKSLFPKYNILFRDDKSYPYLRLSHHAFPRISYYRGSLDDKAHYFGPFPNSWAVRESIHILQKVFRLRNCTDSVFSNRSRPCLLFQINRCSAPCVEKISSEHYEKDYELAINFLSGKHKKIMDNLQKAMHKSSENFEYEKAASYRDQISTLSNVLEKHSMEVSDRFDCDIFAVASDEFNLVVNQAMVRGGRHLGDKSYFSQNKVSTGLNYNEIQVEALFNFIVNHYKNKKAPQKIVINNQDVVLSLQKWLINNENLCWTTLSKSRLLFSPKNPYNDWLKMAERNAESSLARKRSESVISTEKTKKLVEFLKIPFSGNFENFKVECFDVSHLSGESTYCSCVVYHNHSMQPSKYKRFIIKNITASDDYGALRQAFERRFRDKLDLPDFVLIDGGKGQLNILKNVFESLKIKNVFFAGIAKGPNRKVGSEKLVLHSGIEISFENNQDTLMTLAKIRDEAHRFAISGMRNSRKKVTLKSILDDIEGIGPQKRKALLSRFGGLHGLKKASENDLAKVKGISKELSRKIFSFFH